MTEPRIPLLSVEATRKAAAAVGVPEGLADVNLMRMLLRHPTFVKPLSDLLIALLFSGGLDKRLRELLIMRIAWRTGSVYEWAQHWKIARQHGVPDADLRAVRNWSEHDHWSPADRAVLAATDDTLNEGAISAPTWAACVDALPAEDDRLELVAAIGMWRMVSEILRSLEIPLEVGMEAWPPDGVSPDAEPSG